MRYVDAHLKQIARENAQRRMYAANRLQKDFAKAARRARLTERREFLNTMSSYYRRKSLMEARKIKQLS